MYSLVSEPVLLCFSVPQFKEAPTIADTYNNSTNSRTLTVQVCVRGLEQLLIYWRNIRVYLVTIRFTKQIMTQ